MSGIKTMNEWMLENRERVNMVWCWCTVPSCHSLPTEGRPPPPRTKGRLPQRRLYKPHKQGYGRPNHFVMIPQRNIPLSEYDFSPTVSPAVLLVSVMLIRPLVSRPRSSLCKSTTNQHQPFFRSQVTTSAKRELKFYKNYNHSHFKWIWLRVTNYFLCCN